MNKNKNNESEIFLGCEIYNAMSFCFLVKRCRYYLIVPLFDSIFVVFNYIHTRMKSIRLHDAVSMMSYYFMLGHRVILYDFRTCKTDGNNRSFYRASHHAILYHIASFHLILCDTAGH